MSYATWVLLPLGRLDEAFSEYKRAAALDPVTPLLSVAPSMALFHQQEYDRVIEELQKTLELDPNIFWAHFLLGEAYLHKGEYGNQVGREIFVNGRRDDSSQHGCFCVGVIENFPWTRESSLLPMRSSSSANSRNVYLRILGS